MNNFNKKIILIGLTLLFAAKLYSNIDLSYEEQIRQFIYNQHYIDGKGKTLNHKTVHNAETKTLESDLIIEITSVWEQSNVRQCKELLEFESANNKYLGSLSLKVSCNEQNWRMYVPIYVGKLEKVIVLNNNVERGKEISRSDLKFVSLDIGKLTKGYFNSIDELKEKEAIRHLIAGQVLNPMMIDDMDLVHKGDSVLIVAVKGELKVQMPGIALASGERGKQISVRNRSSNRIVRAVIKEKGLVEISI